MADAEIIPLGTRGRPGRGVGRDKPSANSRSLAGGARRSGSSGPDHTGREPEDQTTSGVTGDTGGDAGADHDHVGANPAGAPDRGVAREPVIDPAFAPSVAGASLDDTAAVEAPGDSGTSSDSSNNSAARLAEHPGADAAGAVPAARTEAARTEAARTEGRRLPGPSLPELLAAATGAAQRVFGEDADAKLAQMLAFVRRRVTGEFVVDEYGLDAEVIDTFLMEMVRPLATKWFRVEVRGVENIPTEGGALVVANHSGTVPLDGAISMFAVKETTGRNLRPLGADLVFKLPFFGEMARKAGATLACNEDATRLLSGGELAAVWPEGFKGIGKPYSERYKLQRFGRGGFVSAAIKTGVPIVPCSIVGAEEIYPLVGNVPALARLMGVPYVPITPFFPLLGPLGLVPLPSKWIIEFGEPIRTDSYDPGAADDPMLVFNLTDQVRETIQQTLYTLLMRRKSVFH